MYSLLLAIIYLSFISLGLPDSLIGAGWPVMQLDLAVPASYAGILTVIIACGTVVSSLKSDFLTKKFGTGRVTATSVAVTALALLGFSVSPSFPLLCLLAIPYGLGAGAVDASLNNFVALHYKARHMSWLHCFWGVGASLSPYIMSGCLTGNLGWQSGFQWVGVLQIGLAAVLIFSLPLWRKTSQITSHDTGHAPALSLNKIIKIPGVPLILITFFCYCAIENTAGFWAASFLHSHHSIPSEIAASYASYFFLGITFGRFLCGFVAEKLGDRLLIRGGIFIILSGIFLLLSPLPSLALVGLIIVGLGCAPIYPAIIHATPENFGAHRSQAIIGVQMASAYVGTIVAPALFGVLADWVSIGLYPLYLLILAMIMLSMSEIFYRKKSKIT